ncbi:hypothetical protein ACQ4PT_046773 [Festuca glaucescens]
MYVCGVTPYDSSHVGHARAYVAFDVLFRFGIKPDDDPTGSRIDDDPRKRNRKDFALWKAAKEGEPSWESPWGLGRPGWHIECSAMSARYLGHVFDIHGGGKDLIFPHHENELAQSWAAYPGSEVKCWMHNGFINKDSQKMSKSAKNSTPIREITTQYHPLALRFFLIRTDYKSGMNYSDRVLEIASDQVAAKAGTRKEEAAAEEAAEATETARRPHIQAVAALSSEIKSKLSILGLMPEQISIQQVLEQLKVKALERAGLTEESLHEQIELRVAARKKKQFDVSDQIRKDLASRGIALMDDPVGTVWRPCERSRKTEIEAKV